MTQVANREQLLGVLGEAMPELFRSNSQLIVDALRGAPREQLTAALRDAGFIVGEGAQLRASDIVGAFREAQQTGRVLRGLGVRARDGLATRTYRDHTGRERHTFLFGETLDLANAWARAWMSDRMRGVDPETGKPIQELARMINEKARAVNTPLTAEQGTGGSVLVPQVIAAEIYEEANDRFLLRDLVDTFVSAAPLRFPREIGSVQVSRSGAPKNPLSEVDLAATLGEVSLSPERVGVITYVDPRIAAASSLGPIRWVVRKLAIAIAKDHQRTIATGEAGKKEPRGIAVLPTAVVPVYDGATTARWDTPSRATRRQALRKAMYALAQTHRESDAFAWIMNSDAIAVCADLNDTDQTVWQDAAPGALPKLFNRPVIEVNAIPTAASVTTIVGSDFSQYAWVESPDGLILEQTREGGDSWATHTIGVKVLQEVDGAPVMPNGTVIVPSVTV